MISTIYPDACGFKATDTSKAAAKAMQHKASCLREQCLKLLLEGDYTADELAYILGKSILAIRPRISELVAQRKIWDSGKRHANDSFKKAIVWTTGERMLL